MKTKESQLQKACVRWFQLQYPKHKLLLFAVPNGGKRNAITAANLKAEGVIPGVSDLILLYSNGMYPYLCIEMKFGKNKQQESQIEWQQAVEKAGGKYLVIRTFDGFREAVKEYFSNAILF